jgi:hypothetical protein
MSYDEYVEGMATAADIITFNALIYAAMRKADVENLEILKYCWPSIWAEYVIRQDLPNGVLEAEKEGRRR